jgi:hypothetical protein
MERCVALIPRRVRSGTENEEWEMEMEMEMNMENEHVICV